MKRKALSVLFSMLLLFTLFSLSAFAEGEAVAKIGDAEYATLEEAVAAVPADGTETTITLLGDAAGNGIIVKEGQNVVIDFGGFTYSVEGILVGSTGTETLSFQLLKGAEVTLKNGVVTSTKSKMLVQNYADLTLEDIILDGTKSEVNQYTLSNNFGDTVITGATEILGDENTVAFDVWYGMFATYDEGLSVTFDKDFSGKVVGNIEYGAAGRVTADTWQEKAPLTIEAGSFDSEFVATSDTIEEANIEISGGRFTAEVNKAHCAAGYTPATFDAKEYGVAEIKNTAKIGETEYATLEDAVAAVPADGTQTTVELLSDATGNGIIVKDGQNVVIDFGGFTYFADGNQVGSTGTETLSFQLLKGATVALKNGTLTSTKAKILVQNYADLTLEDIILDGTKSEVNQYTLSNNFGDTVIKGATEILGDENTVAFDVWYGMFATYDEGLSVTFDESFSGTVKGAVEYGAHSRVTTDGWQEKAPLVIKNGSFDIGFVATSDTIEEANIEISGGRFTAEVNKAHCAAGYTPATFDAKEYGVAEIKNTAKIGETEYATLEEAVAAVPADGTEATVTLLSDATGNGIIVKEGQNIVIDFGGFTYFADGNQVGSAGTETLSFQLLKGATVTLRNGTLTSTKTKMLVQNYADLTLEDIILDGTKSEVNQYTLSNNFGDTVIKGATEILGDEDTVAFDMWYGMFGVYDEGLSVTFDKDFSGKVVGNIEYGAAGRVTADNWQEKAPLTIEAGSFDGEFVATSDTIEEANIEISGGRFTNPLKDEFCAEGYEATFFADGMYGVCKHSVKRVVESQEKTCETNGYDKIKCTACEYTITIEYITAGHSFTIYTSDNNATYFEDGTKTASCNYGCGKTDTLPDNGSKKLLGKTSSITATQTVSSITLKWKKVTGATSYRIFVYQNGGWKTLDNVSALTYTAKGLKAGTSYKFAVRAYTTDGETTVSAPTYRSFTTYTRPEPPKTVKVSARTSKTITLSWSKCTGATGYRVYIKTANGWKALKTTTALSYTVTGLSKNTKYTFAVKPYVKYDSTNIWASKYTSFSASTPYLDAPALRVASTAKGRLTAAWEDISGESGYQIYYSTSKSSGYKKLSNYKAGTEKVYETGFESGKTYYFKVRAYTKVDGKYVYSDYSAVKTLKIK